MIHYYDLAEDQYGNAQLGTSVTVYQSDGVTPATIYSDAIGTVRSNPFTTDPTTGMIDFWYQNAKIVVAVAGATPVTIEKREAADTGLTGLVTTDASDITAADSVLTAIGKAQAKSTRETFVTTAGTSTAYTLATTLGAYTVGISVPVIFNVASGAAPTININALGAIALKKRMPDGTFRNIAANDIPINHNSWVTIATGPVAVVEELPVEPSAAVFNYKTFNAPFTVAESDNGAWYHHPAADVTARTITIPANASVALPLGFTLSGSNEAGAGALTIAITTDTLYQTGTGSTGSRTVAAGGQWNIVKITNTLWFISGSGIS